MNKFDTFLAKHGTKILLGLLVLIYFKSCGIDRELTKVKKELVKTQTEVVIVQTEIDTLASQLVNTEEMIKLIKEVPAWKTLRIEEISDKERISINALEEKEN